MSPERIGPPGTSQRGPASGIGAGPRLVAAMLEQNYPNPFNPSTTIRYEVSSAGHVELRLYDVRGRHVRTLVDKPQPTGQYQVTWDGTDGRGKPIASGVYFYRLRAGSSVTTRKLVKIE